MNEMIIGAIIFLLIAVAVLVVWCYFMQKQIKRIQKFNFLIRDDVAEDVKVLKGQWKEARKADVGG